MQYNAAITKSGWHDRTNLHLAFDILLWCDQETGSDIKGNIRLRSCGQFHSLKKKEEKKRLVGIMNALDRQNEVSEDDRKTKCDK